MPRRLWLTAMILAASLNAASYDSAQAQPEFQPGTEAGGDADIALQGYYLGGNSQPLSALSGLNISFREYLPGLGFLTGNLEGYDDSTRSRLGNDSITLHGLLWKGRRWTITGGDFRFRTAMVPLPFTNYAYPEFGARGAKAEMTDGNRTYTLFWGEETLQTGPRITYRISVPQSALGASVQQKFGNALSVAVRYLDLSSAESDVAANPQFFPTGSEFRSTNSLTAQASYAAGGGLTFFADTTLSREQFAAFALYPWAKPFSWLTGAQWLRKKVTITANYGSLSRSALPVLGYYFGDREGPYGEIRYRAFGTLELFGSALASRDNLEHDPFLPDISTNNVTAGANMMLPGAVGVSGQYSRIGLVGTMALDPSQNQSQKDTQSQLSASKTVSGHSLTLTARDLNLFDLNFTEKQRSLELQDSVHFSRFMLGGAVRGQQEQSAGQLENTVYLRANGQIKFRRFSVYGQFETGNDMVNKTLFATNSVNTAVAGMEVPFHGWTMHAEAFRTRLITALNPVNILVLQTQGNDVSDILNNFNQWSFFLRFNRTARWGAPVPQASALVQNEVVYGALEGFVFIDGAARGAAGIAVQLDRSHSTVTDDTGHYRFDEVPAGAHSVAIDLAELPAEFSEGATSTVSAAVRPRALSRADLRVAQAGLSIRGVVRGVAAEDEGSVRLENVVVDIAPSGTYTTCENDGQFAFFNLAPGSYRVSVETNTLPEGYVLVSEPAVTTEAGAPEVVIRIEKRVTQLPVRRVFEGTLP